MLEIVWHGLQTSQIVRFIDIDHAYCRPCAFSSCMGTTSLVQVGKVRQQHVLLLHAALR